MQEELGTTLLDFIMREIYKYMKGSEYKYCFCREDVMVLIPSYLNRYVKYTNTVIKFDESDPDKFMMLMHHKVYFTSPYKDSIIIFDKRYYKDPSIIKLAGTYEYEYE